MFDDTSPFEIADGSILQRAQGHAQCTFKVRDGQTVLDTLAQSGSFKIRLPKITGNEVPEAVLLNTAGGLTGGDHLAFDGGVADGGHAIFTTQAAERAYRALSTKAVVEARLRVGVDGFVEWLPQETILFDGSRLHRTLDIELAAGAKLLAHEAVVFGRVAMGEVLTEGVFRDVWRVERDGELIHADALSVMGTIDEELHRTATLAGRHAMATILYVADDAIEKRDLVRDVTRASGTMAGASAWDGKLLCRIVADDSARLRDMVEPILTVIRDGRALPRVWHI